MSNFIFIIGILIIAGIAGAIFLKIPAGTESGEIFRLRGMSD
ncbi:MAG: hypothetical protein WC320_01685 [Candidatus Paceibacterota bacterium]|jgi:DnaJ-class molecular chaperone